MDTYTLFEKLSKFLSGSCIEPTDINSVDSRILNNLNESMSVILHKRSDDKQPVILGFKVNRTCASGSAVSAGIKPITYMSHFSYASKMQYPLNLVLESWEYLWFY